MRYLVIGLGIYGTSLAKDLTDMGHEVVGADTDPAKVEAVKDYISTAYILDATDEAAIGVLPIKNVDLVIVAIGENFGASIKTVALLRKLGIREIYARAIDELHQAILTGLQVKRILMPEQRAAHDLVNELALGTQAETMRIDRDRFVIRFAAPEFLHGLPYPDVTPEELAGMTLIAASRPRMTTGILGLEAPELRPVYPAPKADNESVPPEVAPGDILTCSGSQSAVRAILARL
ncbi:MAG: NAD-binding protein [Muribaculaceae bacterium]|nr:NAD-binding protein [Muribaculaceae bacterium]